LSRLKKFLDIVQDTPFVLLHENEKGIYGDNATRCHEIMKHLYCNKFKTTFDPANFIQCEVEPYPYAYELLKPYIEYVHIKDAEMNTGNCLPSGYGDGRIKDMLLDLKEDNYEGFLSIEPHLGIFAGYDQLELSPNLSELPSGGTKSFCIAATALRQLLGVVGGAY
jgi:sugar phosphate isomerase/epimerase